jgi:hypothetical protein
MRRRETIIPNKGDVNDGQPQNYDTISKINRASLRTEPLAVATAHSPGSWVHHARRP